MYVRFVRPYIFTPDEDRRSSVKYKAGFKGRVRQQCAAKAIAAGAAVEIVAEEAPLPPAPKPARTRAPRARRKT